MNYVLFQGNIASTNVSRHENIMKFSRPDPLSAKNSIRANIVMTNSEC